MDMNIHAVSVDGRIACPDGMNGPRREIAVSRKAQYVKLPFDEFPVSCERNPEGIGVILQCGQYTCEASLHRQLNGEFWISTPSKRLGRRYLERYRAFLSECGLAKCGMEVKLEFARSRVHIETAAEG